EGYSANCMTSHFLAFGLAAYKAASVEWSHGGRRPLLARVDAGGPAGRPRALRRAADRGDPAAPAGRPRALAPRGCGGDRGRRAGDAARAPYHTSSVRPGTTLH